MSAAPLAGVFAVRVFPAPDGLTIVVRDVTGDRETRAELEEARRESTLLAENASDVVYRLGPDGLVTWMSPSVVKVLGWTPEDLLGTSMFDLMHPMDQPVIADARRAALAGEDVDEGRPDFTGRFRASDGRWVWMSVKPTLIRDDAGALTSVVSGMRDVGDVIEALHAVEDEEARTSAVLDSLLDPHVLLAAVRDADGALVDFRFERSNAAACNDMGMEHERLIGAQLLELFPERVDMFDLYADALASGTQLVLDDFVYPRQVVGRERRYDIRAVHIDDALSVTWRDVTDRYESQQSLAASEERYRLLAENSSDVVMLTRGSDVVWVSPSLVGTLGWRPEDWLGHSLEEFGHAEDLPEIARVQQRVDSGVVGVVRARMMDASGDWHWVEVHGKTYRNADGEPDGYLSSFRVIDQEVEVEGLLSYRATFDDLTGALKRDPALDRLHEIGQHPRTPGSETGVLFIDVDDFKAVNDTHGHLAGDTVLHAYADRIRGSIRTGDTLARMGGDEFLVILTGLHDVQEASSIAEKIRESCAEPVTITSGSINASVSIGATLSNPVESGDELVARADRAMYAAKAAGRNQVVVVPAGA